MNRLLSNLDASLFARERHDMAAPLKPNASSEDIVKQALGFLGSNNLRALFDHCEKMGVKRDNVLNEPEKFAQVLEELFGAGAKIIERQFLQAIYYHHDRIQYDSRMTLAQMISKLAVQGRSHQLKQ
jgi:hypothetical protein